MKQKLAVIFLTVWLFWLVAGCRELSRYSSTRKALPAEVAGAWKAQDSPWKIVLSADGTVSSAVIPMGRVEIKPNRPVKVEMKDGSYSTFKAGDCIVQYTPATRELFVSIQMEKIHIQFGENVIQGSSADRFVGPVSEDGKVWTADWIAVFDYGPRFPQAQEDVFAEPLLFEKIED